MSIRRIPGFRPHCASSSVSVGLHFHSKKYILYIGFSKKNLHLYIFFSKKNLHKYETNSKLFQESSLSCYLLHGKITLGKVEAGQKLGSENVTASTMTLVPGCGNRMIVPSEKKENELYL